MDSQLEERDYYPCYKILILGGIPAGKTDFIRRYVHGCFELDQHKRTIGVDFALKHMDMEDGRHITLQLWDIPGQERGQKMSKLYYQDAHACVIIFDLTYDKSLEISLQWKEDLDSKCTLDDGDPIPCMPLANKVDLVDSRKFSIEEIAKFAKQSEFLHFMEISVKENINVKEVMQFLVKHLLEHGPKAWRGEDHNIVLTKQGTPKERRNSCWS